MPSAAFAAAAPVPRRVAPPRSRRRPATARPRAAAAAPPPAPAADDGPSDGPAARLAIALFRFVMRPYVGRNSARPGYAGLVDDCRTVMVRNTPAEQRAIVTRVLSTMFVAPRGPRLFRENFADKPEINAKITPPFFRWLVGPAEVNDSPETEVPGTGVLIEKCRFLDESGCRGLCLSMCQGPTQAFFTEELGLPLRM